MLDISAGLMSQMGDAALGPMGKHMMFTGKQLVNDNVCPPFLPVHTFIILSSISTL